MNDLDALIVASWLFGIFMCFCWLLLDAIRDWLHSRRIEQNRITYSQTSDLGKEKQDAINLRNWLRIIRSKR